MLVTDSSLTFYLASFEEWTFQGLILDQNGREHIGIFIQIGSQITKFEISGAKSAERPLKLEFAPKI